MQLLQDLSRLQNENGFLSDELLRDLAERKQVPLYRLEGLVSFYPHFRRSSPPRAAVHLCRDVTCQMAGCQNLLRELQHEFQGRDDVELREVSCLGRCDSAPAVMINEVPLTSQTDSRFEQVQRLIENLDQLPVNEPAASPCAWKCDPYSSAAEHYGTVKSLVQNGGDFRSHCVAELKQSGLRGMGGAGFPTGLKWDLVAGESAPEKYVICNADESEPATFKDRVLLEQLSHLMLEGMLFSGLTIGAERGIIYLRHEYSREGRAVQKAIEDAYEAGVLGENACGSGRRFEIELFLSPGGYILGEETALLEALEDKRGEPRNKPPYPGQKGLWGRPTLINNVETFILATAILHHGQDWWQAQGSGQYAGLKAVSICGDVERPGVYEIPHGLTVAELVDRAGGMKAGKPLKAFLPGGASSNFLPAEKAETPLDFEAMQEAGSMLGTGAVLVVNEDRDLFDLASNLVRFFRNESCGKCVPCRVGTEKTVALLDDIQAGDAPSRQLEGLPALGQTLEQTSICGLGQVALNPILSMMQHFPAEVPQ